jgi:hypothetical protein
MGVESNKEYWLRRASEQRARSRAADDLSQRDLHEQLAKLYEVAASREVS